MSALTNYTANFLFTSYVFFKKSMDQDHKTISLRHGKTLSEPISEPSLTPTSLILVCLSVATGQFFSETQFSQIYKFPAIKL